MTFIPPDFLLKTEELCKKLSIIIGRKVQSKSQHDHRGYSMYLYFEILVDDQRFPIVFLDIKASKDPYDNYKAINKEIEQRFKDAGL